TVKNDLQCPETVAEDQRPRQLEHFAVAGAVRPQVRSRQRHTLLLRAIRPDGYFLLVMKPILLDTPRPRRVRAGSKEDRAAKTPRRQERQEDKGRISKGKQKRQSLGAFLPFLPFSWRPWRLGALAVLPSLPSDIAAGASLAPAGIRLVAAGART